MSVSVLIKNGAMTTGEGPHWEAATSSLLYVDIVAGDAHKWNSITQVNEKIHFEKEATVIVPRAKGGYLVCVGNKLCQVDWDTKSVTTLAEVDKDKRTRFNDGKCDARGRFWAGTMGLETAPAVLEPGQGSLYCYDLDGSVKCCDSGIDLSNGLAWNSTNTKMYFCDSIPRKVYVYDFDDEKAAVSNRRVAIDFCKYTDVELGLPDGMCIDTDDKIWVACYNAGKVVKFDPETGAILQEIKIPARRSTSCAFGGPNFDEMIVSTSNSGVPQEEFDEDGGLPGSFFKVTGLGVKGLPPQIYQGV